MDFGEFLYYDAGGQEQKGYALTISFPHSDVGHTQAFPSQNQECLPEGMKRIFEHMGGVPRRLRFDNMTTAVAQVLRGTERSLTDGFSRFMLHYRFQAEFCNPASGNEKGNVENKVGYSREMPLCRFPLLLPLRNLMRNTCGDGAKKMPSVTTTSTRFRSWNCGRQMRMRC